MISSENVLFDKVKTHLKQKYNCHTIILFGSYITGDYPEESDLDVVCFSESIEDKNDVESFEGKQLEDVWIYNTDKMDNPEQFLRVNKGEMLLNNKGFAEKFLSEVSEELA